MGGEDGPERAHAGLQKGHSCDAAVALSAFKCGSFASSESRKKKISGYLQCFKVGFLFSLGSFCRYVFVDIIRHYPASRRDTFHRFLLMCERCIYSLLHPNIDSSILKAVLIPVQ